MTFRGNYRIVESSRFCKFGVDGIRNVVISGFVPQSIMWIFKTCSFLFIKMHCTCCFVAVVIVVS